MKIIETRNLRFFIFMLRGQALNIALAISIAVLIAMVAAVAWLSMTSPAATEIQRQQDAYFKKIQQDESIPAAERAWKRLHRSHGEPGTVIYEPGKEPWYVNAAGQKCRFI